MTSPPWQCLYVFRGTPWVLHPPPPTPTLPVSPRPRHGGDLYESIAQNVEAMLRRNPGFLVLQIRSTDPRLRALSEPGTDRFLSWGAELTDDFWALVGPPGGPPESAGVEVIEHQGLLLSQKQQGERGAVDEGAVELLAGEMTKCLRHRATTKGTLTLREARERVRNPELADAAKREHREVVKRTMEDIARGSVKLTEEQALDLAMRESASDVPDPPEYVLAEQAIVDFVQENPRLAEEFGGVGEGSLENVHPVSAELLGAFFAWNFSLPRPRYGYRSCKDIVLDIRGWEFKNLDLSAIVRSPRSLWRTSEVNQSLFKTWRLAGKPRTSTGQKDGTSAVLKSAEVVPDAKNDVNH